MATACKSCLLDIDVHMTTVGEGSVSPDSCLCKASFFYHRPWGSNRADECVQCDLERVQCTTPGVSTAMLHLQPGHWRASRHSTDVRSCFNAEACEGGDESACRATHFGPYCTLCESGYFLDVARLCQPCRESMQSDRHQIIAICALVLLMRLGTPIDYCSAR